tara:strand:- start:1118 stop:2326 length:1209 start_codon:yes stop_codon:yes gene_type:complete
MRSILPVILCGGVGSRIRPISEDQYPKQFLSLASDFSLLQDTMKRLHNTDDVAFLDPVLICNKEHRSIVKSQLDEINMKHNGIILEPMGKNTAPAASIGSFHANNILNKNNVQILLLPSDHFIKHNSNFLRVISFASKFLLEINQIILFGIKPDSAHTGYGYIELGEAHDLSGDYQSFQIKVFKEKPTKKRAEEYLKSGNFLWNSGMFLFNSMTYLKLLERLAPKIYSSTKMSYLNAHKDSDFYWLDEVSFSSSPADSIDYALMEKSDSLDLLDRLQDGNFPIVFPMNDIGWNDIGSWSSLWHILNENCGSEKTFKISNKTKDFCLKHHKITDKKDINRNKSDYFSTHWIVVRGGARIISDKEVMMIEENESIEIPNKKSFIIENSRNEDLEIIECSYSILQ